MKSSFYLAIIVACLTSHVHAQQQGQPAATVPGFLGRIFGKADDFQDLNRQRRKLLAEINVLERDMRSLQDQQQQLERDSEKAVDEQNYLARLIQSIDAEINQRGSQKAKPLPIQPGRPFTSEYEFLRTLPVESLRDRKGQAEQRLKAINERTARLLNVRTEIGKKRGDLETKQSTLAELEERIGGSLNIETNRYVYRTIVSLIFAAIVFLLVVKFFGVVDSDESVKKSIFAGGAGIQFITLFSIVIAVILFGILEILGANELAALLGGLSGYILGRNQQTTPATPAP